jgi:hypothetical protein
MDTQDLVEYMSVRQKAYQTQGWQPLVVAGLFTRDYCGARSGCRNWQPSRASPRRPDFTIVGCCHTWVATFSCCWLGGLPVFLFWLVPMAVIWLYLLGVSTLLSGHFTGLEIAMTVVVGIASGVGIVAFFRLKSHLSGWGLASIFIVHTAVQLVCFRLSFLPAIAHR